MAILSASWKSCSAPCGDGLSSQSTPEIYSNSALLHESARGNVMRGGGGCAGSRAQPVLWQCENFAHRVARQDFRDGFLLCHARAHTTNLPLLPSDQASQGPQGNDTLFGASSLCHTHFTSLVQRPLHMMQMCGVIKSKSLLVLLLKGHTTYHVLSHSNPPIYNVQYI